MLRIFLKIKHVPLLIKEIVLKKIKSGLIGVLMNIPLMTV
jgi:hypothetical protein